MAATLLKRDSNTGLFLRNLRNFQVHFFYRTSPVAASDLVRVTALKRFMKGRTISSFCRAPCTKPLTSKTTEI